MQKRVGGAVGSGWGGGGQGGCERRIEVIMKIQKESGLVGVRVDVNEKLKYCENAKMQKKFPGGGPVGGGRGSGVRVDLNEELKLL